MTATYSKSQLKDKYPLTIDIPFDIDLLNQLTDYYVDQYLKNTLPTGEKIGSVR